MDTDFDVEVKVVQQIQVKTLQFCRHANDWYKKHYNYIYLIYKKYLLCKKAI